MIFEADGDKIVGKGPIAKFIPEAAQAELIARAGIQAGDALFFAADKTERAAKLAGLARTRIGTELKLVEEGVFKFCWIVDMPMYEWNEDEKRIDFGHNPFSLPQFDTPEFMALDPEKDRETILGIKVFSTTSCATAMRCCRARCATATPR